MLRAAAAYDLTVVPRGAGTGLGWGAPPAACDLVVDMSAMDQVLEHAAGDLVARVQAGATIGHLASVLAEAGQELAVDAPAEATVGGVVATGTAGPRRLRYGTPRDLLIGITIVRADGAVAHSGGKVVKNVAGYDLGKLFSGSQGHAGADHRGHVPAAPAAWRGGLGHRGVRAFGPGRGGRGGGRRGGFPAGALGGGAGVAGRARYAGAAADGRTARRHVRGRGRPGQPHVRADRVVRRDADRGAVRGAVPLAGHAARRGRAQHRGPGLVLGQPAGRRARRAGRGGRGRGYPARGQRAGRAGLLYACLDAGADHDTAARFVRGVRERLGLALVWR